MTDDRAPPSADPADRLGVFKRFADIPAPWRHDLDPTVYDGRDMWAEYDASTGALTTDSERQSSDMRLAVESWNDHMADKGRHPMLAHPSDVEEWCADLLSRMAPKRAYNPYWVTVEKAYMWLSWHRHHPHVYNVFVMAAAEYPEGAAHEVWNAKMARRATTDGGTDQPKSEHVVLTDGGMDIDPGRAFAGGAGVDADPLAALSEQVTAGERALRENAEYENVMDWYLAEVHSGSAVRTRQEYQQVWREWSEYLADAEPGRHPACPAEYHVRGFAKELCGRHQAVWARSKVSLLANWYEWFTKEETTPAFPSAPFRKVYEKYPWPPDDRLRARTLTVNQHRRVLADVTHERDLAWILLGLKLGMREGEVLNVQLQDVNLTDPALRDHYPKLGSHRLVRDHSNAIYIPPGRKASNSTGPAVTLRRFDDGHGPIVNKSRFPRVMPLDEELRAVLTRYLLARYDAPDQPWLFLTETHHDHFRDQNRVNDIWQEAYERHGFEEDEAAGLRGVTSHTGRHFFSDYWESSGRLSRSRLNYIRGDSPGAGYHGAAIGDYLHPSYADIEDVYRTNVPRLLSE
ncbi:site-specific integrase [Natronomonas gomsonensis]|uniref:site-specific integrase n=1 Tax=Natronomonas gomsonensis TaxID=1046043 RepID=UPI0015BE92C0|nr:site-specific integrase [Natronomonas gomsonensis]